MPHSGDWREANVVKEAFALNCPLLYTKAEGTGSYPAVYSFASADAENVVLSVLKQSCDGEDIIIRAYEAHGKRTESTIAIGTDIQTVTETDMLETTTYETLSVMDNSFTTMFKPYEIKTFRIKK